MTIPQAISTAPRTGGYHLETFRCHSCGVEFQEQIGQKTCSRGGIFEALIALPLLCDGCAVRLSAEAERAAAADTRPVRMGELLRAGLVCAMFQAGNWAASKREIEALNQSAWSQARAWFSRSNRNLFISGGVGTGKTTLAHCCLNEAFDAGHGVAEVSARRLVKVCDTFAEGNGLYTAWKTAKYLLIDDVDKAAWNPERLGGLWELLDARLAARRRTIVTSNLPMAGLTHLLRSATPTNTSLAEATLDRLKPCLSLELTGQSQRPRE